MKLKFKKGSPKGDFSSSYSAKLPNGNILEVFKAGNDWAARELTPNGEELTDEVGCVVECGYYATKRDALLGLRKEYEQ